jgi:selenide,water dikinase
MESLDNAGVYKLRDDLAIIQTVDFFTPIVDDPYIFGQIAAANSLSDVYTMGGQPITALNLVGFPSKTMDIKILQEILRGGIDKMREARVVLMGGHSIEDPELKYGLSVTGTVHPKKLITNGGARPGDVLILTKPLGTGIISTAIKAGVVKKALIDKVSRSMAKLNNIASELMQEIGVHACTDITGFSFLGHSLQLAKNSKVGLNIQADTIPFFPGVKDLAGQGFIPGGLYRNRDFYFRSVKFAKTVPDYLRDILFDPQTSGGLLICVSPRKAGKLINAIHRAGITEAVIIGEAVTEHQGAAAVN